MVPQRASPVGDPLVRLADLANADLVGSVEIPALPILVAVILAIVASVELVAEVALHVRHVDDHVVQQAAVGHEFGFLRRT